MKHVHRFLFAAVLISATAVAQGSTALGQSDIIPANALAIVYESVIDQQRSPEQVAEIVAELKVDYLHRGFFRWRGFAELERKHDVYGILAKAIATIKQRNPDVIFGGALAAQEINLIEHDPLTGQVIHRLGVHRSNASGRVQPVVEPGKGGRGATKL